MDEKAKQIARASANELKSSHGEGIVLEVERAILNDGSARQSKTYIPIEPT
jgi:hypothetical protein